MKNRAWLEIQFLRTIHQIDLVEKCLISTNEPTSNKFLLSELLIEPTRLLQDLYTLADSFQKLHLDNAQLAVLSAIFIFQPEFLPDVMNRCSDFVINRVSYRIWKLLNSTITSGTVYSHWSSKTQQVVRHPKEWLVGQKFILRSPIFEQQLVAISPPSSKRPTRVSLLGFLPSLNAI